LLTTFIFFIFSSST